MKIIIGLLLLMFGSCLYSQQKITITFCNEMHEEKMNNLIRVSLIQENDTMIFSYLGNDKYFNPLNLCGEPISYDKSDSLSVIILVENCKYAYKIEVYKHDLPYLDICIENKVNRFGKVKWNYSNYYGRNLAGFTIRQKKIILMIILLCGLSRYQITESKSNGVE